MADSLMTGWDPESLFGLDETVVSTPENVPSIGETSTEVAAPVLETPKVEEKPKTLGKEKIEVSSDLLRDAKDLGEFLKTGQGVDDLAIKLASIVESRSAKQEEMLRTAVDNLYYTTPEGQEVKKVMDKYQGRGLTREAATAMVRDGNAYRTSLEQRTQAGDQGTGITLNQKDRKVLSVFGNTPEQYYKDINEMRQGRLMHYLDTGGLEVEIDIPMKKGVAK